MLMESLLLARTTLIITTPAGLEGAAKQELRRLLLGMETRPLLFKGNVLVETEVREGEALALLAETNTELIAQVLPVQARQNVVQDRSCFDKVATAAAEIARIKQGETFLVRCHRRGRHDWSSRELERAAAARLSEITGGIGEIDEETDWLVNIEVYQEVAYIGINRPSTPLRKPLRRQRKYPPGERPINRAQWKIQEALETFSIVLPPHTQVLDIGSAPGGWAAVLASLAERVIAVDPAELAPTVIARPNVTHLRMRVEELSAHGEFTGQFDLLTNDMNLDPDYSAWMMCRLAPLLKPSALAIMTVKFTTRRRRKHERVVKDILSEEYDDIRMRRLPHNARETTAAMRKKTIRQAQNGVNEGI